MEYKILMPRLSDSMEEGKLISWKVKEGDKVKDKDVIAEVESDKAIMEIQPFKNGIIKKLLLKEGESASVGEPIAVMEVSSSLSDEIKKEESETKTPPSLSFLDEIFAKSEREGEEKIKISDKVLASPKAKMEAFKKNIDISLLQKENKLPVPTLFKDIKEYQEKRYFTPKAWKLLKDFDISPDLFEKKEKYGVDDVLDVLREKNIPLKKRLNSFKKALISNVENSSKKPVYHIYDFIDSSLIKKRTRYSMTVWFIKLTAMAMKKHKEFRTVLKKEAEEIYQSSSVSVAVASGEALFMPVIKDADIKSVDSIAKELEDFRKKAENFSLKKEELEGSTFGLSNLGMFGIYRFDAMINKNDCGIIAIGEEREGKIAVTLTLDHRVINGYQGALFMNTLKSLALDPMVFK